ncbi:MAG: alkaline phosphatase, partial [Clostridia bacterium]|nr:alkaline phosphatase [Clostridia bacterium]
KSYTDSAAAGTALACGFKTVNGYIAKNRNGKDVISLRDLAHDTGAKTAILTTDKITGATPAVFLAHQYDRVETDDIQKQIDKLVADGGVDFCEGSVDNKLLDRTRAAMRLISSNGSSFFTMIEEAYTDKGAHNNKWDVVYNAVKRINSVGYYLIAFTAVHPDTVLLITADHETGGITEGSDGKYDFTVTTHTHTDVPVYGLGPGVDTFLSASRVDNTDISKFIAKLFTQNKWGE